MNINELMIKNENELTVKQMSFLEVHTNIMTLGGVISNALVNLAKNLKRMKDEELFKEAGFETFDDYSEQACGLKRRQAYNYIKVLDNLGEDFVHSNAQIGIAKLTLLTTLPEEKQVEVLDNTNIEETSVAELREQISKLKEEMKKTEDSSKKQQDKSKDKIKQLQIEIESLKNKPNVEVEQNKVKIDELNKKLSDKEKEVADLKEERNQLNKKIEISSSSELVEFKLQFDNLQNIVVKLKTLIPNLPEEKREGCQTAIKKVVESLC